MPDLRKMTVQSLRELARKVLGPGHARLKTKAELVSALEEAEASGPSAPAKAAGRVRAAASRAAEATGKAARAAKEAGKAAKEGAKSAAARTTKAAAAGAAVGARAASKPARVRKAGKVARAAAVVAGAAMGAAVGAATAVRGAKRKRAAQPGGEVEGAPDPEGFFVARVRGEEAIRQAPHPLVEGPPRADGDGDGDGYDEGIPVEGAPVYDEQLGDLPWGYGDDAFVALPRDPRTTFLYWDHSRETLEAGFGGLDHPRAQLWLFARAGADWERVRVLELALEARGYYVHDLEPGRTYRAEIHVIDRSGHDRLLARPSNDVQLPQLGPSPIVDDRFIRIPWEVPLGRLLGPGHAGAPFSEEARAMLSRLSDWSRFAGRAVWGGSAGGMGGRPSSATSAPSSPVGPIGTGEK
jgi:uncharacterized protein